MTPDTRELIRVLIEAGEVMEAQRVACSSLRWILE